MTCSTGSTILLWSHGRMPVRVRKDPIRLSSGHPLFPCPPALFSRGIREQSNPRDGGDGSNQSKALYHARIGGGRRRRSGPGDWKEERNGMEEEEGVRNGSGRAVVGVATKSRGEKNIGWSEDPANKIYGKKKRFWTLVYNPPAILSGQSAGDTCTHQCFLRVWIIEIEISRLKRLELYY